MRKTPVTAQHIAIALVAACRQTGVEPPAIFTNGRGCKRTRVLAAAGTMAQLGWRPSEAARIFRVDAKRLSPSMLSQMGFTTDDLLVIGQAFLSRGLALTPPTAECEAAA